MNLPLAMPTMAAPNLSPPIPVAPNLSPPSPAAVKATILVVDDTPDNLELMSNLLKDEYRVKIANSGERALKIAGSAPAPDLILLDVMMPDMDGYEVCRRLKADAKTATIPVIFLTARAEAEDEQQGLELGAVDYLAKPISPPIVLARVKNHLQLKAMSDFLQTRNTELEQARAAADKANLAKSEFLSGMSHELRSPLNAILGFAQLMEAGVPAPNAEQKESLDHILQAGWHLLTLINEILDLAKIESGQVPMTAEPVALDEVLLECLGMMELPAQQRGITLSFPTFFVPYIVLADRIRVKQVLLNLLSNAIKYNAIKGQVEVSFAEGAGGRIRTSIRDTGGGLSPEQVGQLFQPFNRLDQEGGEVEGTGIGLVLVKRLIELMEGEVGVDSVPGIGSVFWFELNALARPVVVVPPVPTVVPMVVADLPAQSPPAPVRVRYTVLYIEDNPANLLLVEQLFSRRPDLCLLSAVNGYLGIEMARISQPDLILMDIKLPGINGYEALKILLAEPVTQDIPVVAISANNLPLDIEGGLRAGFFRYLTKPFLAEPFMQEIDAILALVGRQPDAVV